MTGASDDALRFGDWLNHWAARFDDAELSFGHGTDNAWDEAVALGLGVLGWADDAALLESPLSTAQCARLDELAQQRITERIPVPLLIGRVNFAGLEFLTAPDVMIPRSPIAELIRTRFAPWLSHPPKRVLDVCCGGGCIGLGVAHQFPESHVVLSDVDAPALALAQRNVAHLNLGHRSEVVASDLYNGLGDRRFDLIVSNPPYVPSAASAARPQEFQHEPELAYDGGENGMQLVRRLLAGAAQRLTPDGLLVIEVGQWHGTVEALWPSVPFVWAALEDGGEGVMVLDAAVVAEHTAQFALDIT